MGGKPQTLCERRASVWPHRRWLAPTQVAKTERAARQQGSSFLRENSPNGGKTIRTFWLHSRGVGSACQGEILDEINLFNSIVFKSFSAEGAAFVFDMSSPFRAPEFPPFLGVL